MSYDDENNMYFLTGVVAFNNDCKNISRYMYNNIVDVSIYINKYKYIVVQCVKVLQYTSIELLKV